MTEKEMLKEILKRLNIEILYEKDDYIEFENSYGYEQIFVEFDDKGDVTAIGC